MRWRFENASCWISQSDSGTLTNRPLCVERSQQNHSEDSGQRPTVRARFAATQTDPRKDPNDNSDFCFATS